MSSQRERSSDEGVYEGPSTGSKQNEEEEKPSEPTGGGSSGSTTSRNYRSVRAWLTNSWTVCKHWQWSMNCLTVAEARESRDAAREVGEELRRWGRTSDRMGSGSIPDQAQQGVGGGAQVMNPMAAAAGGGGGANNSAPAAGASAGARLEGGANLAHFASHAAMIADVAAHLGGLDQHSGWKQVNHFLMDGGDSSPDNSDDDETPEYQDKEKGLQEHEGMEWYIQDRGSSLGSGSASTPPTAAAGAAFTYAAAEAESAVALCALTADNSMSVEEIFGTTGGSDSPPQAGGSVTVPAPAPAVSQGIARSLAYMLVDFTHLPANPAIVPGSVATAAAVPGSVGSAGGSSHDTVASAAAASSSSAAAAAAVATAATRAGVCVPVTRGMLNRDEASSRIVCEGSAAAAMVTNDDSLGAPALTVPRSPKRARESTSPEETEEKNDTPSPAADLPESPASGSPKRRKIG